ncbi:hypothetical protein [Acinetobacter baumannii]|uniref:hypothetical protein n=1 Tax=Acinetobacter baumannii TaxID=470 RepID=UPI0038914CE7
MQKYILKAEDQEITEEALELFQQLGYELGESDRSGMIYAKDGKALCDRLEFWSYYRDTEHCKELTLPQLRDLVAQNKSNLREYLDPNDNYKLCLINPSDAAHWMIEVPDGAELYVYWRENDTYNFQVDKSYFENGSWQPCAWTVEEIKSDKAGAKIFWSRKQKQDPALISGAEALRALADGKEVDVHESTYKNEVWFNLKDTKFTPAEILAEKVRDKPYTLTFRLKPQTIKLELELPKPFEPKDGETYWHIYPSAEKGYHFVRSFEDDDVWCQFGAWRTEEEVKQVVEQLRKIRGTNS